MQAKKRKLYMCFAFVCLLALLVYIRLECRLKSDLPVRQRHDKQNNTNSMLFIPPLLEEETKCNFPKLDYYNPIFQKYVQNGNMTFPCERYSDAPLMFQTDFENNLIFLKDPTDFGWRKCCYHTINRTSDSEIVLSKDCVPISQNVTRIPSASEFISVHCRKKSNMKQKKAVDAFHMINLKPEVESRVRNHSNPNRPISVVVLGLDSVSHMHFIRAMPKSYMFLTQNLSAIGMNGYVKVGENTFPNVIPALTGLSVAELTKTCWPNNSVFDDCPVIWKDFSAKGYRTSFSDDVAKSSIFNHNKKGFRAQPTDYYARPLAIFQYYKMRVIRNMCAGPRLAFRSLLEDIEKMAWTMMGKGEIRKYFQFVWETSVTHDEPRRPGIADDVLFDTLLFLKVHGFLDNMLFILMSDHGFHNSFLRKSFQGRTENRMPLMYFVVPPWFIDLYYEYMQNLRANSNKLLTAYDFYATLKDFLAMQERTTYTGQNMAFNASRRGISLFQKIPANRTCEMAGIDPHFCVCNPVLSISTEEPQAKMAAEMFVSFINKKLANETNCSKLSLKKIHHTAVMGVNESDFNGGYGPQSLLRNVKTPPKRLIILLQTFPGDGKFEVTFTRTNTGNWTMNENGRVSLYGNQSHCVADYQLKKYCFCTDLM